KRKLGSADELDPPASSNKRAKSASQPPAFTKHSRFWALDGNVILQFGSVAFKVHRSRLSTQSKLLLFEKRTRREEPLKDNEKDIDDVVVQVLDGFDVYQLDVLGTMEDFEALLTAMEDAIEFYYDAPPFLTLAAIFRAATTFKFHKFKEFASQSLLDWFSSNVGELNAGKVPYPAAAVVLGREWNLPGILKRAFYELLRTPPAEPTNEDDKLPNGANRLDGWVVDDIIRLGETQKQLTTMWLTLLTPAPAAETCPGKTPCLAFNRTAGWRVIAEILQQYRFDPICGLNALTTVKWARSHGFCQTCALNQTRSFEQKKTHIWEQLDVWLNI
ncbi:hypothetical protein K438DRAFT_1533384, partial [Mycena galopus ATCC 62051]